MAASESLKRDVRNRMNSLVNGRRVLLGHEVEHACVGALDVLPDLRGVEEHALEQARLHVLTAPNLLAREHTRQRAQRDEEDRAH